jgi:hypothetical protein
MGRRSVVYVALLDEGADVWRPADAEMLGPALFHLAGEVPQGEVWQFQPGEVVYCQKRTFADGAQVWVAVQRPCDDAGGPAGRGCSVGGFPPSPVNDEAGRVSCPAFGRVIDTGLCWECCMADHGGPTDTAESLRRWVVASGAFASVADFQRVCAGCPHCAWRAPEVDDGA